MSILLTIIRVSLGRLRTVLVWTGVLFGVTWAILFAQIWWVCEANPNQWKSQIHPQCPLGTQVAVAQVITDVLSDAILILAPIQLVWRINLDYQQKIRVVAIFSTTLATTAISLNHAYFVLKWGGLPELLAAVLQISVSLIVANLSVVIAFLFRITTEDSSSTTCSCSSSSQNRRHARRMGPVTRSLIFWQNWVPLPITSTFRTVGGVVRDREYVEEKRRRRAEAAAAAAAAAAEAEAEAGPSGQGAGAGDVRKVEDPRAPTPPSASQITQSEPTNSVCHDHDHDHDHGKSAGKAAYETR
uniref:Rhodopsin domain-containing protein n=1 Tax=Psilocybe cubensis TaxID=181762 RepID=A0A8H8CE80_PSICU